MNLLTSFFCPHRHTTTLVLQAAAGVETLADKCRDCGKLINKRIEV